MQLKAVLSIGVLIISIFFLSWFIRSSTWESEQREIIALANEIQINMNREDVEIILNDAERHMTCATNGQISIELYLFGHIDKSKAHAISVTYEITAETEHVIDISIPTQEFLEHSNYENCVYT